MRWIACPIALILFLTVHATVAELDAHPMDYVWDRPDEEQVDLALELLEHGSDPERRWVARHAAVLLLGLDSDEDDTWAAKRMDRLRSWIAREPDDFVLSRVIRGIHEFEETIAGELFLDLLRHPSPNVRREAIRFYVDSGEDPAAVPILEHMWVSETREWIRDDLIEALASMGSSRFIDDFSELAQGDDPQRAALALEALGYLDDSRAMNALVDLASDRAYPLRVQALDELAYQSESSEARDVLLTASLDDDDRIRLAAISAFPVSEGPPELVGRLREIARSDDSPEIRKHALIRLGDDAEVESILHGIVGEPRTPQAESLVRYAEAQLAPPPEPDPIFLELMERQRAGEEVDWEAFGYELVVTGSVCRGLTLPADSDTPGALALQADPGRATTRCWSAPGVAADFFVNERIAGGTWVTIEDHHEYRGEHWVALAGAPMLDCWVPRERLGESPEDRPTPQRDGSTLHEELDVFTGSPSFAALWCIAEYGTVEFFDADRESGVEAVAVDLEPTAAAIRGLLDSFRGTDDDAIDCLVLRLLRQVPASLDLEDDLRNRLDALVPRTSPE